MLDLIQGNGMFITGPIPLDSLPPVPWKNGGGVTRTLAVEPAHAGMDDFLWRISIADLHASGSFSSFPGVDRTILLWSGVELTLHSPQWPSRLLTTAAAPFLFAGEDDVRCELASGSSQDLNLMVRRGMATGSLQASTDSTMQSPDYDDLVVLCAQGALQITVGSGNEYILKAGQFLRISQPCAEARLIPVESSTHFIYASMRGLARQTREMR